MFDEFVEHAGTPEVARKTVPQLETQGFEPDDPSMAFQEEPETILTSLETGYFSANAASAVDNDPLFVLGRVQVDIPGSLVAFAVASDMLYMGCSNDMLIHINLKNPEKIVKIPLKASVYKLFLDPSGRHLLIATTQGENWYLCSQWKEFLPRPIKSFKMVIETVAWNTSYLLSNVARTATTTREMLIGGRNGIIYEGMLDSKEEIFRPHDRNVTAVFTLPERTPITGLCFQWFPPNEQKRGLVVVTTATRIYQFVGSPTDKRSEDGARMFSQLFSSYKGTELKFLELPGSTHSELHARYSADRTLITSVAWLTGQGIYYGLVNYGSSTSSDALIDSAQLLPYPPPFNATSPVPLLSSPLSPPSTALPEVPVSISLTEFHFLSLFNERISSVSTLDSKADYEEIIPLKPSERMLGLASDPVSETYWVYTDSSLFELTTKNETRDVWQVYMRRGEFDAALKYARTPHQRDTVIAAQGDAYLSQKQYAKAAERFAQTSRSFEQVALALVDSGDRDALQYYLVARLSRTRKTDLTQRMMLATWLVEFYLGKYNDLDDLIASESAAHDVEDLKAERAMLDKDLKTFFETYRENLDRQTVYDLILSHGRTEVFLYYATIIGDFQRVVSHWILEEEWEKAINVISSQEDLDLYYRYASVLIRQAPKLTVDAWIRQPTLDAARLIPALLQLQHQPRDPVIPNQAIRYLNHIIFEQQNVSSTVHNLLITLYASPSFGTDDRPLLRFLSTVPKDIISGKPYYDLDYALRICRMNGRIGPCVSLYAEMGLWENSVDLALQVGDLELAKANADRAEEEDIRLKKKLWLKIAKYVVQDKQDIKSAMAFIKDTSLLKIEDILPFFPDFVVIDDFKDEICLALEEYKKDIDKLDADMNEAEKSAGLIQKDIANLKSRFVTLEPGERCSCCNFPLFTRQFYVFPCQHCFHADCLIGLVKEYLPAHALRKILLLQAQLLQANNPEQANGPTTPSVLPPAPAPRTQRTLLSSQFGAANGAANVPQSKGPATNQVANGRPASSLITNPMGGLLAVSMAPVSLGRNMFVAADRLKDMIVPDALANAIALPSLPWGGTGANVPTAGGAKKVKKGSKEDEGAEKVRESLDELLASSCPLCESMVAGLDKPFIEPGEVDTWQL
ncbi:Vacuolar protein sorting-associated protein 18 homolog [Serendipita indica DSM 11827]|uniref:Related to DigA protein n=1 Tax=Serendipita indica (strain DSM 11827) TaxID=1109443 RepID=G4TEL2_SERID|nr:Vacuolar protein sorting-associated protein 18 homolog [Serendipita indica DSM 11827]CCA69738.1 related to DigA protein [Serendipita indica DSM 11827]